MTTNAQKPRLLYIDNLRILLIVLVILHHTAIAYGGPGGFNYIEDGPISDVSVILMTLMLAINQAFFMGFFFMISSYFSPGSIDRKGTGIFLKDRFKRLGIPLVFYMLVISPLLAYLVNRVNGYDGTLWEGLSIRFSDYRYLSPDQLWFVAALLIFAVAYVIWRQFAKPMPQTEEPAPGSWTIAVFALVVGIITFFVRIWWPVGKSIPVLGFQFAHFPQYIAMYVVGLIAYRRSWFETLSDAQAKIWLYVILGLLVAFPVMVILGGALEGNIDLVMGGVHWQSFAYSIWEQFMCVAMVITLLVWFRRRFTQQGPLAKTLSGAAYGTYVFHAPTIILPALALRSIQLPDMGLKYLLVVPFVVSLAFLVGYTAKRLPVARDVL